MAPNKGWKGFLKLAPKKRNKIQMVGKCSSNDREQQLAIVSQQGVNASRAKNQRLQSSPDDSTASSGLGHSPASSSSGWTTNNEARSSPRRGSLKLRELSKGSSEKENSNNLDKSSMRSLQTPLSIVKGPLGVGPLNVLFSSNNKVGSSFLNEQFTNHGSSLMAGGGNGGQQQVVMLTAAANGGTGSGQNQSRSSMLPVGARKVRDSGSLLFMMASLGFLAYIIWDGVFIKETDVNLIVHGHDSFGNICGRDNKPIRFAERSGKNYTDRPYTKYTLINSQFERYSIHLDQSRSKSGELVYVKEDAAAARLLYGLSNGANKKSKNHTYDLLPLQLEQLKLQPLADMTSNMSTLNALDHHHRNSVTNGSLWRRQQSYSETVPKVDNASRIVFNSSSINRSSRLKRQTTATKLAPEEAVLAASLAAALVGSEAAAISSSLLAELSRAQQSNNRTLLNAIKSNLMYQYPPMYGYNGAQSGMTTTTITTRPSLLQVSRASVKRTHGSSLSTTLKPSSNGRRVANGDNSVVVFDSESKDPIDARDSFAFGSVQQHNNDHYSNNNNRQQQMAGNNQLNINEDHLQNRLKTPLLSPAAVSNESDRFEHTLVTPISVVTTNFIQDANNGRRPTTTSSESPPILSSSDATNQLLYLTECVSSCPRDHVELIFYRCMPNNWRFSLFPNAINVTRTFIDDILTDLSHCYKELIYTFSLALVLSLGLLILLRFLASIIIWSCILLLISLFISMASYSWITFYNQILELNNVMPHDPSYGEKLATSDKWLIGSIFLTFVAFALIGAIIFMRKRILLVTMLFRESGKAIADMPLLLLQPLFTFAALVGIMAAWTVGLICLQSVKRPVIDFSTGFVVFKAETLYKIMKWYYIFAFLWVSHFAIACQHYVIGASVSKWYFSSNRYELSSPIGNSISELILYYLGSVALGSFLAAIFKVIRIITKQIQFLIQRNCITSSHGSTQMNGSSVSVVPTNLPPGASSSSCCGSFSYVWRLSLWFIDNIVMIINRDAYVEIAIHGDSFISGARRAFTVLASNPLRLFAIKSVGNLLLVIAKICVVFGTVSVAYVLLEEKNTTLNYSWSPIVISAIYAYIVAHWFLSVYEMVIDALFICYCEDYEMTKNHEALAQQIRGSTFMSHILNQNAAAQANLY